jgi:putative ABC transport system permease protein
MRSGNVSPRQDADKLRWLTDVLQDARYGLRAFRRQPGFTLVAVVTLAVGIGATTAIFSLVNGVLMHPLPYRNAERLVRIDHNRPDKSHARLMKFTYFTAIRDHSRTFDYVAAYDSYSNLGARQLELTLPTEAGAIGLAGTRVSPDLFPMLGIQPALGRVFDRHEAEEGHNRVVVVSHAVWQQYFGGRVTVLGQSLQLDHNLYTVIGVMRRGFYFPDRDTSVWIPLTPMEIPPQGVARSDSPDSAVLEVLASLKAGVSIDAATADTEGLFRYVDKAYGPASVRTYATISQRAELVPLKEELIAPVRPALRTLPFAVALVLLIACANVANLLLARSASRRRELAIRAALGAGRFRLTRQALTESVLLSLAGGVTGFGLASLAIRLMQTLAPPDLPRIEEVGIDPAVVAFGLAVSLLTVLMSGLMPALRMARADQMETIRESHAAQSAGLGLLNRYRFRGVLVVAEIAMATVLLVGAGLLVRSFTKLLTVNPGYEAGHILTFQVVLPEDRYPPDFYRALPGRLESHPAIQFAGTTDKLPILGVGGLFLGLGGLPIPTAQDDRLVMRVVSAHYLAAMGTAILQGRGFSDADREGGASVMLISQTLARRHFGPENPIGRFVSQGAHLFEIVGVVEDIRHSGLDVAPQSEYYVDVRQSPVALSSRPYVVVRGRGNPAALAPTIRAIVHEIDPRASVDLNIATMQEIVSASIARPRFYATLLGIFGAIAVGLAAIGIYGVIGYSVAQRTQEMGIRLALGAARGDILALVMRQGFSLFVGGLAIGLASAASVTRFLETSLFGVTSLDAATFAGVCVTFTVVAGLAIYLPARRATRVDPIIAFRTE